MFTKKNLITVCIGIGALVMPLDSSAQNNGDECSQDMLMSYFPERFVAQVLERYQVPKTEWSAIQKELAEKNKEVVPTVEEKAAKMSPNPLRDPEQRQEAVKIFRETLFELFAGVMRAHGYNDREQIQKMLDDIQQQKAAQFAQCMQKFSPEGSGSSEQGKPPEYPSSQRGPKMEYNQKTNDFESDY